MALNSPSNLSLGRLGHIAGGNAGTTNQTSLAATCRGANSQTSMWSDFRIGTISFVEDSYNIGGGTLDDGTIILSVPNTGDVGNYMGASTGGTDYYVSQYYSDFRGGSNLVCHIGESGAGSLYVSRIQNRSSNAADYVFSTENFGTLTVTGSQIYTEQDKFSSIAPE